MLEEFGNLILAEIKSNPLALFLCLLFGCRYWCSPLLVLLLLAVGNIDDCIFVLNFLFAFLFDCLFLLLLLSLLHLLYKFTLDLLLDGKLLVLQLIPHQLLDLQHILGFLFLGSHILSPLHFESDEGTCFVHHLQLSVG